jgi:hypothetical protein
MLLPVQSSSHSLSLPLTLLLVLLQLLLLLLLLLVCLLRLPPKRIWFMCFDISLENFGGTWCAALHFLESVYSYNCLRCAQNLIIYVENSNPICCPYNRLVSSQCRVTVDFLMKGRLPAPSHTSNPYLHIVLTIVISFGINIALPWMYQHWHCRYDTA